MNTNTRQQQSTEGLTSTKNLSKLKSSRYKGVVPQHNGRWGAQIYECHRRIWLGTFADELDAARVYDIAALRFRGVKAATNFKRLCKSDPDGAVELLFLMTHKKAEIVRMLRNHTYDVELYNSQQKHLLGKDFHLRTPSSRCVLEFLFNKTVTPSDVGKLNRLVIPKQHAEKHLPIRKDDKISINFQDGEGKIWRFTYSYWNSSQSYVMTKGWRFFVKEKGVKDGDVISFWRSLDEAGFKQYLIDIFHRPSDAASFVPPFIDQEQNHNQVTVRLFGVDICKSDANRPLELDEKLGKGKEKGGWSCFHQKFVRKGTA